MFAIRPLLGYLGEKIENLTDYGLSWMGGHSSLKKVRYALSRLSFVFFFLSMVHADGVSDCQVRVEGWVENLYIVGVAD